MGIVPVVLKYLSNFSHLLPVVAGWKNKSLLWWYAITAICFDLTSLLLKQFASALPGQGNLFLLIEFVFICIYYSRMFAGKIYIQLLGLLLSGYFLVHTLFLRPQYSFEDLSVFKLNLFGGTFFYLTYILFSVSGFYKIIKHPIDDFIEQSSFFWVNVSILIYSSGVFFIFLFAQIIEVQDYKMISLLWNYLFCSLNIIKNIFLAKALSVENGSDKR